MFILRSSWLRCGCVSRVTLLRETDVIAISSITREKQLALSGWWIKKTEDTDQCWFVIWTGSRSCWIMVRSTGRIKIWAELHAIGSIDEAVDRKWGLPLSECLHGAREGLGPGVAQAGHGLDSWRSICVWVRRRHGLRARLHRREGRRTRHV